MKISYYSLFLFIIVFLCEPQTIGAQTNPISEYSEEFQQQYQEFQVLLAQHKYWKAIPLGENMLQDCPEFNKEVWTQTAQLYYAYLENTHTHAQLINRIDSMISLYSRAMYYFPKDSGNWLISLTKSLYKFEKYREDILYKYLKITAEITPLKLPPYLWVEYFRLQGIQLNKNNKSNTALGYAFIQAETALCKQLLLTENIVEQSRINKSRINLGYRFTEFYAKQDSFPVEFNTNWKMYITTRIKSPGDTIIPLHYLSTDKNNSNETIWIAHQNKENTNYSFWLELAYLETNAELKVTYLLRAIHKNTEPLLFLQVMMVALETSPESANCWMKLYQWHQHQSLSTEIPEKYYHKILSNYYGWKAIKYGITTTEINPNDLKDEKEFKSIAIPNGQEIFMQGPPAYWVKWPIEN